MGVLDPHTVGTVDEVFFLAIEVEDFECKTYGLLIIIWILAWDEGGRRFCLQGLPCCRWFLSLSPISSSRLQAIYVSERWVVSVMRYSFSFPSLIMSVIKYLSCQQASVSLPWSLWYSQSLSMPLLVLWTMGCGHFETLFCFSSIMRMLVLVSRNDGWMAKWRMSVLIIFRTSWICWTRNWKGVGWAVYLLRVDELGSPVKKLCHYGDRMVADVIDESGLALESFC